MTEGIFIALALILTPFLEHFFRSAGFLSLFAVLAFVTFAHMGFKKFLLIFVPLSIILDVTFHLDAGTHLTAISFSLLVLFLLNRVLPTDNLFTKSLLLVLSFTLYWIVFSLLFSIQSDTGLFIMSWNLILSGLGKAVLSTALYYIGEFFVGNTRGESKSILKFR
jgi:hypothetical protein